MTTEQKCEDLVLSLQAEKEILPCAVAKIFFDILDQKMQQMMLSCNKELFHDEFHEDCSRETEDDKDEEDESEECLGK